MAEVPIAQVRCQVYCYDGSQWASRDSGISNVAVYHNQSNNMYRVVGLDGQSGQVSLGCALLVAFALLLSRFCGALFVLFFSLYQSLGWSGAGIRMCMHERNSPTGGCASPSLSLFFFFFFFFLLSFRAFVLFVLPLIFHAAQLRCNDSVVYFSLFRLNIFVLACLCAVLLAVCFSPLFSLNSFVNLAPVCRRTSTVRSGPILAIRKRQPTFTNGTRC